MNWIELNQSEQISEIKNKEKASLIFKHSTRCSISKMALKFFERDWKEELEVDCYFLDILNNRNLSNQIAETFHVHHESPQIIVIRNTECILDASHSDISVEEVEEVLSK
jgi:bacillithiol system protein YtxJ